MLLAIAVFAILVVMITGILGQLDRMWVQTEAQNQRDRSGRALLNFMARDIKKAMMPLNISNTTNLDFVINPSSLSSTYGYRDNIFFQAPIATDSLATSVGEIAEVGYFVQWQPQSGSQVPTAQLCRFFVNPSDTVNYQIYLNPTSWITTAYLANVAPGASASSGNPPAPYKGLLAENVIGLWINPYDKNGNAVFTASRTYDSRTTSNLPAVVDISILVLDPATAKRLGANSSMLTTVKGDVQTTTITNADQCLTTLPAVLQPGASCFTTRVQLSNSQ